MYCRISTQANSGGHCKPDLDNLNNLNNLIPRTAPFLCCALMTRRGTRRTPAEAATTEQTLSDEATAAPDGHETGGAGDIAPNNRAEEARAARRPGPGRPKAEDSPNTKAAKDRDRWALWVRSSLDSITSTTTYLDSFRVCLPVFLLCALPSHRSASDALTVLGASSTLLLEDLRAKPRRAFEIMDEEPLRAIMVQTLPQSNHHLPSRARGGRPSSHLSYSSFLLSLSLYSVTA